MLSWSKGLRCWNILIRIVLQRIPTTVMEKPELNNPLILRIFTGMCVMHRKQHNCVVRRILHSAEFCAAMFDIVVNNDY